MTVDELLLHARRELAAASFGPSRREANLLLASLLGWDESRVLSRGESTVPRATAQRFDGLLKRRVRGEPIAYLLGRREFYGRSFFVDQRVLIPRPETEHLVEAILGLALPTEPRILDIGTGSGCLAVTLASEIDGSRVVAVDQSLAALRVAATNVDQHLETGPVALVSGDLATAIDLRRFDLVVSNPPYVDIGERATLSPEITRFEPPEAVFAPKSGDSVVRRLLSELSPLRTGRLLLFEIGMGQSELVARLLEESSFELLEIRPDLAGIPRTVIARRR